MKQIIIETKGRMILGLKLDTGNQPMDSFWIAPPVGSPLSRLLTLLIFLTTVDNVDSFAELPTVVTSLYFYTSM